MNKKDTTMWTPEYILSIVKETLGHGSIDKEETNATNVVITLGKQKSYRVNPSFLEMKEVRRGKGAAIQTIMRGLKVFDENASWNERVEEEAKDIGKRKLHGKAKEMDAALEMSGSSKKEKDEILKNA